LKTCIHENSFLYIFLLYLSICGQCNAGSIPVMDLPTGDTLCIWYIPYCCCIYQFNFFFICNVSIHLWLIYICKVSSILMMDLPTGSTIKKRSEVSRNNKAFFVVCAHLWSICTSSIILLYLSICGQCRLGNDSS